MRHLLLAAGLAWMAWQAPAARAQPAQCPDNFEALADSTEPLVCGCSAAAADSGSVWGMDVYTADSSICRAAVHAGAIPKRGGTVTVMPEPGRAAYPGLSRNGVASTNFGAFHASFRFKLAEGAAQAAGPAQCPDNFAAFADTTDPLVCTCTPQAADTGSVWGMDTYTSDSAVCRAAVHAGAIPRRGGTVTVLPQPGRAFYPGARRFGVSSTNYGAFASSFSFQLPAGTAPPPNICPDDFGAYKDGGASLTCQCAPDAMASGSVWGVDVYTADSAICRAALHAGAVPRTGGEVTVLPEAGRAFYPGVTRFTVSSNNYGAAEASYRFKLPEGVTPPNLCPDNFAAFKDSTDPVPCTCTPQAASTGSVWGTDVYTADSAICRAALHAGVIRSSGGPVTVVPEAGRASYPALTRNGVTSSNYDAFEFSFRFDGPVIAATTPPTPRPTPPAPTPAPPPAPPPPPAPAPAPARQASDSGPVQQPIAATIRATGQVQLYVTFRFNSADIDISAAPTLTELRDAMIADPALRLRLIGHTDAVGTPQYNLDLSRKRAQAVMAWLVSQGIPPNRLTADGMGATQPLAGNDTEQGRAMNRRVQAVKQ